MSDYSYFCSSGFGLYRCPNWKYDNSVPTWEHIGQTMSINEFALDLNDPDEFQACRSGDSIYVRRPTAYGNDDWDEVYSVAAASAQFGGQAFVGFHWVEINSAPGKEGHMYTQGHTGLATGDRRLYCLKSTDYGETWSRGLMALGTIQAAGGIWAGRVTGDVMYATANGFGLTSRANALYSSDEGVVWPYKHESLGSSLWVSRILIDPTNEATSFAGATTDGPNLHRATTVDGEYLTNVKTDAGIAIFYGFGGGWISAWNSNYVRTIKSGTLYYSDTSGDSDTWNENNVSDKGHGSAFERAMWGHDRKPWEMGVCSRTSISEPTSNWHLLKSTQDNGGTWYDKAGANASTITTGGGDSIPYNCGGIAENGLYLIVPGQVFTSVVAMQALPTAGTVYADGVQMGTLPTGGTVYAAGVEQESPRQT